MQPYLVTDRRIDLATIPQGRLAVVPMRTRIIDSSDPSGARLVLLDHVVLQDGVVLPMAAEDTLSGGSVIFNATGGALVRGDEWPEVIRAMTRSDTATGLYRARLQAESRELAKAMGPSEFARAIAEGAAPDDSEAS